MMKHYRSLLALQLFLLFLFATVAAQENIKFLPLPVEISSPKEEFSGLAWSGSRLYLLPQYGNHKETLLDGPFSIYSIEETHLSNVIEGKDTLLNTYRRLSVKNLHQLPDSLKKFYQGFEAITIVGSHVFLAMETDDDYDYCFLLKGLLDVENNEITIDPVDYVSLKRYPYIFNAGFESLTYLPDQKKLLALFEFNAMPDGGRGFLIDPSFKQAPQPINTPFLPFRITDIEATAKGRIYALNYYWEGDYKPYLTNNFLRNPEQTLKKWVADSMDSLKTKSYARIVTKKKWNSKKWEHVTSFHHQYTNWEGLVLYKNGALVITDANRIKKLRTELAFLTF
jgi:hypothetical protein